MKKINSQRGLPFRSLSFLKAEEGEITTIIALGTMAFVLLTSIAQTFVSKKTFQTTSTKALTYPTLTRGPTSTWIPTYTPTAGASNCQAYEGCFYNRNNKYYYQSLSDCQNKKNPLDSTGYIKICLYGYSATAVKITTPTPTKTPTSIPTKTPTKIQTPTKTVTTINTPTKKLTSKPTATPTWSISAGTSTPIKWPTSTKVPTKSTVITSTPLPTKTVTITSSIRGPTSTPMTTIINDNKDIPYDEFFVPDNLVDASEYFKDEYWIANGLMVKSEMIENLGLLLQYATDTNLTDTDTPCVPYLAYGYRSYEKQKELYNAKNCDTVANCGVAYPGYSNHQSGYAIDLFCTSIDDQGETNLIEITKVSGILEKASALGFNHPISWDTPHFEYNH